MSAREVRNSQERRAFDIVSGQRGHSDMVARSAQLQRHVAEVAAQPPTTFSPARERLNGRVPTRQASVAPHSGMTPTRRAPSTVATRSPKALARAGVILVSPTASTSASTPAPRTPVTPRRLSPSAGGNRTTARAAIMLAQRIAVLENESRETLGELAGVQSMLGSLVGQLDAGTREQGLTQKIVNQQLDAMAEMVVERMAREARERLANEERSGTALGAVNERIAALAAQHTRLQEGLVAMESELGGSGGSSGGRGASGGASSGGGGIGSDVRLLRAAVERLTAADTEVRLAKLAAAHGVTEERAGRAEAAAAENAATAVALRDGAAMLVHALEEKVGAEVALLDRRVAATEGSSISQWRAHQALEGIVRAEIATRLEHERYAQESALAARRAAAFRIASLEQAIVGNTEALERAGQHEVVDEALVHEGMVALEARLRAVEQSSVAKEEQMRGEMAQMEMRLRAALDENAQQDAEQDEDSLKQWERIEALEARLGTVEASGADAAPRMSALEDWNFAKETAEAARAAELQRVAEQVTSLATSAHASQVEASEAANASVHVLSGRQDAADSALRALQEECSALRAQANAAAAVAATSASSAAPAARAAPAPAPAVENRLAAAEARLDDVQAASPRAARRAQRSEDALNALEDRIDSLDERIRKDHREVGTNADAREDAQRKVAARAAAAAEAVHEELRGKIAQVGRKLESVAGELTRVDDGARDALAHVDSRVRALESRAVAAPAGLTPSDAAAAAVEGSAGAAVPPALEAELATTKALLDATVRRVDRLETRGGEEAEARAAESAARCALETKLAVLERVREEAQHSVDAQLRKLGSSVDEAGANDRVLLEKTATMKKKVSALTSTMDALDERTTRLDLSVRHIAGGGEGSLPAELAQEDPVAAPAGAAEADSDSSVEEAAIARPLPKGWQEGWDSVQNAAFYSNIVTGETQWERPTEPTQ